MNDSRYINPVSSGGYGLHAQWNDDFHHGIHALVTGEKKGYYQDFTRPELLVRSYSHGFAYEGQYSQFRKRRFGNSAKSNPGQQFVVFAQNHDQVGNRKYGKRLAAMVTFDMLKVIAAAVFISPFRPMLFMGEEYGENNPFLYFVNHNDQELNRIVKQGRQNEFKSFDPGDNTPAPDPSDIRSFLKSKLTPDPFESENSKALFNFYKMLIYLKLMHPVLSMNNKENIRVEYSNGLLTIERWYNDYRLMAFLNTAKQEGKAQLPTSFKKNSQLILNSAEEKWKGSGGDIPLQLAPNEEINIPKETIVIYSL